MLYLRTASGGFLNAESIIALSPQRDDDSAAIAGWIATCADGQEVALAAYYLEPGRIEQAIHFMPGVNMPLADHPTI